MRAVKPGHSVEGPIQVSVARQSSVVSSGDRVGAKEISSNQITRGASRTTLTWSDFARCEARSQRRRLDPSERGTTVLCREQRRQGRRKRDFVQSNYERGLSYHSHLERLCAL